MIDTYAGMILPGIAGFMELIMMSFFKAIPKELIEVTQIDGAKHILIFSESLSPFPIPSWLPTVF
jgi:ABC-type glycerol-3-phosphate transport system permease component